MGRCAVSLAVEMSKMAPPAGTSDKAAGKMLGVGERTARRHRTKRCICYNIHEGVPTKPAAVDLASGDQDGASGYTTMSTTPWGLAEWREFIQAKGQNPDSVTFLWGVTSNPAGGYWNKLNNVRPITAKDAGEPAWPVIQPAARVNVSFVGRTATPVRSMRLAIKCADTQIGFRVLPDGNLESFHDDAAMDLFVEVCREYQPDKVQILGDFLDLAAQSRWVQESGFANTTQMALDRGHLFLALLRAACPDADIDLIEGNHDKRMQSFIESNALAAFGLKRANMPASWPALSLPSLLRLDELGVHYVDAYPAATVWDNDLTRNIHGTRVNSKGSTTAQYLTDAPHINTWAGHTHRAEITYRTVIGPRGEAIESYSANPGCLCKTDGTVPGVHSALHSDGSSARVVEDWQQGIGFAHFNDTESWPFVYRIRAGRAIIDGKEFTA